MTKAKIETFCRANTINIGFFDGTKVFPSWVTDRNIASFLYNNHFCLIWKSEGGSFIQTIIELKENFEKVDNYITEANVKYHFKFEFMPKKLNLI